MFKPSTNGIPHIQYCCWNWNQNNFTYQLKDFWARYTSILKTIIDCSTPLFVIVLQVRQRVKLCVDFSNIWLVITQTWRLWQLCSEINNLSQLNNEEATGFYLNNECSSIYNILWNTSMNITTAQTGFNSRKFGRIKFKIETSEEDTSEKLSHHSVPSNTVLT